MRIYNFWLKIKKALLTKQATDAVADPGFSQ